MPKKQKQNELREKIKYIVGTVVLLEGMDNVNVGELREHLEKEVDQLTALYKQEIALKIEEIEGLMEGMMPLNEEVNFEEDNEAGIRREVLYCILEKLKQNKCSAKEKEIRDGCGTEDDDRKHCLIRERLKTFKEKNG